MKSNIAFISDDILFLNLLSPLLKRVLPNIQIYNCNSFREIDEKIGEVTCDLILVDGGLKTVSSIEIIHYIRLNKHILAPIWFFPEILTRDYIHKAKEMGVTKIIDKPFDPYQITDEIVSSINISIKL